MGRALPWLPRVAVAEPASEPHLGPAQILPQAPSLIGPPALPDQPPFLPCLSIWSQSRILFLLQMISMCQGLGFPLSGSVPLGTPGPPRSDAAGGASLAAPLLILTQDGVQAGWGLGIWFNHQSRGLFQFQ